MIIDGDHIPTAETREFVERMAATGLDEMQIAYVLNCQPMHVRQYYKDEIEFGHSKVTAQVASALVTNALRGDTNAQRFWLERKAGWHPPPKLAIIKDGSAAPVDERRALINKILQGQYTEGEIVDKDKTSLALTGPMTKQ